MNFDNLMHYDLMTRLYVYPVSFILLFRLWPYSLHFIIQRAKEFEIHSVETVSEVNRKSSVTIVTMWNEKGDQKVKRMKKNTGQILPYNTKNFQ